MNQWTLTWTRTAVILSAVLLGGAGRLAAAEPAAGTNDVRLAEAERLHGRALRLYQQRRFADAVPLAQEELRIREQAQGAEHLVTGWSLAWLATLYRELGAYAQAEPLLQRAVRINVAVLGSDHSDTIASVNNLALLHGEMGDFAAAEPLLEWALGRREQVLGPKTPATATSLNNLGLLYTWMGDYRKAEPLYQRALRIREQTSGPDHPDTAIGLNNLAELYRALGDYARAQPLLLRAQQIAERVLGQAHPTTALFLNNLAGLHELTGDYAAAEALYRRALKLTEQALGPDHPDTAMGLANLAGVHKALGEYARAEPLMQRALRIREATLGPEHPDTALSLNNLAQLYRVTEDYALAEPLLLRALKMHEEKLGPEHPRTAMSCGSLAGLYEATGDYAKAEPLLLRALKIAEQALGPEHLHTAQTRDNLASLYVARGDCVKAEQLLRRSLETRQKLLDQTAVVQSERQQLAMTRATQGELDAWLSLAARAGVKPADEAIQAVLSKGQVAARQASLRRLRTAIESAEDPTAARLFASWESTSRQLATLATASAELGPKGEQRLERLQQLTERKEQLERDLSARSEVYRQAERRAKPALADLRQALARWPGAALVELIEYARFSPPKSGKGRREFESHLLGFVVRGDTEEVWRIELGAAQPIHEAVAAWRAALEAGTSVQTNGQKLRELVWLKLEPALAGTKTVVLSPDGALCRLPFGALPGSAPGSYLLEDYAFALLPIPRLLPDLLAAPPSNASPSLVVIGDVDYGAAAGRQVASSRAAPPASETRGTATWTRLRATGIEVEAVRGTFGRRFGPAPSVMLGSSEATEGAFRSRAPRASHLHVATHGYFADPSVRSALAATPREAGQGLAPFGRWDVAGWNPGLLSGLVLAGANLPPTEGQDDGILTALEVQALDLRGVELAVLSACETGLGESAGGEGLLGLQRAFQLAGARTTIGSLWKVPDAATRELMGEFYRRLWQEKQGRLEALRGAQLWMLEKERNRARTGAAADRGVKLPDGGRQTGQGTPRAWAAFVLSGDWR